MMANFTDTFTRMRQDFDQAQADRDQLFQDTREHVQDIAQGVKDQLAGFRQNMRDMHEGLAEMADQVRNELQELSTDLHTGGDIFRKSSSPKMPRKAPCSKTTCKTSSRKANHSSTKPKAAHKAKAKQGR
jgi:hypothetical protein